MLPDTPASSQWPLSTGGRPGIGSTAIENGAEYYRQATVEDRRRQTAEHPYAGRAPTLSSAMLAIGESASHPSTPI